MSKVKILGKILNKTPWIFPLVLSTYLGIQSYLLLTHTSLNLFIFQPSNLLIFIGKCIIFIASIVWLYFSVTKLILIQKEYKDLTFKSFVLVFLTCGYIACMLNPIGLLILVIICLLDRFYSVIMNLINDMDRLTKWELKKKCPWIGTSGTVADDYEGDWLDSKYDDEFSVESDGEYTRHQEELKRREREEQREKEREEFEYKSSHSNWENIKAQREESERIRKLEEAERNRQYEENKKEQQRKHDTIQYAIQCSNGYRIQVRFEDGHEIYVSGTLISSTSSTITARDGNYIKVYDIYGNTKQTRSV